MDRHDWIFTFLVVVICSMITLPTLVAVYRSEGLNHHNIAMGIMSDDESIESNSELDCSEFECPIPWLIDDAPEDAPGDS